MKKKYCNWRPGDCAEWDGIIRKTLPREPQQIVTLCGSKNGRVWIQITGVMGYNTTTKMKHLKPIPNMRRKIR